MDIMRLFGRAFAGSEEVKEQNGQFDGSLHDSLDGGSKSVKTEAENPVVLRQKLSQVNNSDAKNTIDDAAAKKAHRVSLCDFNVGIEVEAEKKYLDADDLPPKDIQGTDWESACYTVDKFACEDEVTSMDASGTLVAVQYHIDPNIDVYDWKSKQLLFKLEGHTYGGQCLKLVDNVLYSGSMDKTVRSWNLLERRNVETIYNHLDYVQSLSVLPRKWVASGGRGDKAIFVYETDETGKLWRRHRFDGHEGWVTQLVFLDEFTLVSGSEDAAIRLWDLRRGTLLRVLPQDDSITALALAGPDLLLFGDRTGKLSFLDVETRKTIHLLPNILVATGCYCRSSKYHDKAVDVLHVTDNGYLITASAGSKFIKIWRITRDTSPTVIDHERTEVKELQILREHSDFLTTFVVQDGAIFSTSNDGYVYTHAFPRGIPHYEMAVEQENASASAIWNKGIVSQEKATEVCMGPRLCKTGKVGLVRSSSSFQVKFSLNKMPKVCADVNVSVTLPRRSSSVRMPATVHEDEEDDGSGKDDDTDEDEDESELTSSECDTSEEESEEEEEDN